MLSGWQHAKRCDGRKEIYPIDDDDIGCPFFPTPNPVRPRVHRKGASCGNGGGDDVLARAVDWPVAFSCPVVAVMADGRSRRDYPKTPARSRPSTDGWRCWTVSGAAAIPSCGEFLQKSGERGKEKLYL